MSAPDPSDPGNPCLRANSLAELLAWNDVDFVRCAYVTVLGRQPDPEGEAHFRNHIRGGLSKLEVLWRLRRSTEAANHDPGIAGFDRALRRAAWRRARFIGWIMRAFGSGEGNSRADRRHRSLLNEMALHRRDVTAQNQLLLSLLREVRASRPPEESVAAAPQAASAEQNSAGGLGIEEEGSKLDLSSRERYVLGILENGLQVA